MDNLEQSDVADTAAWVVGNQVEATVPERCRTALHLSGGQHVAISPTLHDMEYRFSLATDATGDRANHRRLKGRDDSAQLTIRFPAVLAAATGLLDHVQNRSKPKLRFARDDETADLSTWPLPPLRPEIAADAGQTLDVAPAEKRLLELPTEYAAELDKRFASALGLAAHDPVAWWLTVRNAGLALVADFDSQRIPDDGPTVRKVQVHQSGVDDALTDQYRVYVPKALVHALNWDDEKLRFELERQRLVVQPALDTR